MKKYFILLVLSLILSVSVNATDVQRMDPPFWYAGMQNSELQIMFYGENLGTYSSNLDDYPGVEVKEICGCPKCSGQIIEKKSKRGKVFYGCNNYPKCKTAYWDQPVDRTCPLCGEMLVTKNNVIKCSACEYQED